MFLAQKHWKVNNARVSSEWNLFDHFELKS